MERQTRVWRQRGAGGIRVSDGGCSADSHMLNPAQAPSSRHTGPGGSWQVLARIHPGVFLPPSLPWSWAPSALASAIPRASSEGPSPLPTPHILFSYCSPSAISFFFFSSAISKIQIRSQHSPHENLQWLPRSFQTRSLDS